MEQGCRSIASDLSAVGDDRDEREEDLVQSYRGQTSPFTFIRV